MVNENGDGRRMRSIAILTAVLIVLSLRLLHLDADQPESIWSENVGEFIDEGSKVLDARNIVLFDSPRIGPEDDNPGWMHRSPITQWVLVGAFNAFSPSLATGRVVSLAYFGLFLLALILGPGRRYRLSTVLIALALFGVAHLIFIFSRTAVFEMALILAVYTPVLLLRTGLARHHAAIVSVFLALMLLATFGIKASGLMYLGLAALGVVMAVTPSLSKTQRKWALGLFGLLLLVTALMYLNLGEADRAFRPSIELDPSRVLRSFLEDPLFRASPILVASGFLCLVHWLSVDPAELLSNRYRAALAMLAVGGPISLAFLTPSHLRYHAPLLPAYLLLIVDWIDSRPWAKEPSAKSSPIRGVMVLSLVASSLVCLVHALNRFVLAPVVLGGPGSPTRTGPITLTFLALLSIAGSLVFWRFKDGLLRGRSSKMIGGGLIVAGLVTNLALTLAFLIAPEFRRRAIAAQLEAHMSSGQVLAGDWSPYFTIDTRLKALWVSERFSVNTFDRLPETRPDFILYVETRDEALFEALPRLQSVELGEPVGLGDYLDLTIMLYPVRYTDS